MTFVWFGYFFVKQNPSSVNTAPSSAMHSKEGSPRAYKGENGSGGFNLKDMADSQQIADGSGAPTTPTLAAAAAAVGGLSKSGSFRKKTLLESNLNKSSMDKLLNPSMIGRPDIAPYRVVLGHVRQKLVNTRRRMEEMLEGSPCDYDPNDYYETGEQLLEPLMMCHESMESCRSEILADGRLTDLIRRYSS